MKRHMGKILAILGVLVLALAALPLLLTQGFVAQAVKPGDKIEPDLLARLTAEGPADFIVRFAEQANLAPAYRMNWHDRGEFVYNSLQETAARSQGQAKEYLDGCSLRYQTFIAGNDLYVWAGDLNALNALAEMREVASLRLARTYYLDPIIAESPTRARPNALAWGITDTKADQFWTQFGVQGNGIVVAGIDTGVQWDHPALDQAFKCGANPSDPACWADPANVCGGSACDNNGHGTHTMGTMVADDDPGLAYQAGMAPNAQWIACKGCESNSCSDASLNACADWILAPGGSAANRPNVVNNSWGGGGGNTWYLAKVNAWRAAGVFPAFSAGNEGEFGCNTLGSPGDYQESFATAAHDSGRAIAYFSSRGPSAFGHDPYTKPNVSAPGVDVCSTVPGSGWNCGYSGTSMASPHTAGAVALLWSCNPALIGQIDQTFQALQNTANTPPAGDCGAPPDGQGNYTFGYGYLDILAAGMAHCAAPVTPTPTSTPTNTPTPLPPVTPIAWVDLPNLPKGAFLGPTPTATPSPTPGTPVQLSEGFEGGVVPPAGWTEQVTNPSWNWKIKTVGGPHTGLYAADVEYDPDLIPQDEWLLSPLVQLSSGTLTFWTEGSVYWCRDTYDNCDLEIWLVVGTVGGGDDVYLGLADDDWPGSWVWAQSTFNLTPYLPGGPIRLGFRYVGTDGAQIALDDILLDGQGLSLVAAP
jgi:hypothetical protein